MMFLQSDSPFRINISLRTFPLHYHLRNISIFSHQLFPCLKKLKKGTQGNKWISLPLCLSLPLGITYVAIIQISLAARSVTSLVWKLRFSRQKRSCFSLVSERFLWSIFERGTKARLKVSLQKQLNLKRKQAENRVVSLFVRNAGMSPLGNFREDLENL